MELKQILAVDWCIREDVLIVPSGIETKYINTTDKRQGVLIVPSGIETK